VCRCVCVRAGVRVLVHCYRFVLGVRGYWCVRAFCGRSCVGVSACMSGRVQVRGYWAQGARGGRCVCGCIYHASHACICSMCESNGRHCTRCSGRTLTLSAFHSVCPCPCHGSVTCAGEGFCHAWCSGSRKQDPHTPHAHAHAVIARAGWIDAMHGGWDARMGVHVRACP